MIRYRLLLAAWAFAAACGADKPNPGDREEAAKTEPAAKATTGAALPPLSPLGKPATELEAEGWKAVELPPELAGRLRDSTLPASDHGLALRRELQALAQPANSPSPDSTFTDTVRLIEGALTRMGIERHGGSEAEIVDSLERAMQPRDPDLDAVPARSALLRHAPPAPAHRDLPIHRAAWRGAKSRIRSQAGQTATIQLAPGVNGTETTSSDGSTTTEVGFKRGNMESTTKSTTSSPNEYEQQGEIGFKIDVTSTKRGKVEGASQEEIARTGFEKRLGYCPDAGGLVKGKHSRWEQSSTVTTVGTATVNQSFEIQSDFTLTVTVDDDARAQEILVEGSSVLKLAVGARGGGNARPTLKDIRADIRWQKGVHDNGMVGSMYWRFSSAAEADRRFDNALLLGMIVAMDEAEDLVEQAERRWRKGACVEVIPHPEEKPLRYGGKATFRVEVKHKREGDGSFPYPVRIMAQKYSTFVSQTLGKLAPSEGSLTAPASFGYTAPAKGTPEAESWRNSVADRAFPMSISRRGIGGRNFYIPYDTLRRTFHVSYHRTSDTEKHGMRQTVTYRAVLRELDQPDDDGDTFAGTGEYNLVARIWKANCASYAPDEMEAVNGGGAVQAKGSISSEDPQSISLIFQLVPTAGPKIRLFTKSFSGLEQAVRKQTASGNQDDVPFMASQAVGLVTVRGKMGDTTKVVVTGESECEGEMTTKTVARVMRLR